MTYRDRADCCLSNTAQHLLRLMDDKKTNIALSADVNRSDDLINLVDRIGPEICLLKTHIDIIDDFTKELPLELKRLALKHRFLIFEDRKFADIGNTVKQQYAGGIFRIVDWADFVNAHVIPGPGIITGLAEVGRKQNRGLILLAEMSSKGHLMDIDYVQQTLTFAEQFPDFVVGFITQHAVSNDPHWINFTPGVKLVAGSDKLAQQYVTPEKAILENGADVLIVGRGIIEAEDPLSEAQKYRAAGWKAYLERCK